MSLLIDMHKDEYTVSEDDDKKLQKQVNKFPVSIRKKLLISLMLQLRDEGVINNRWLRLITERSHKTMNEKTTQQVDADIATLITETGHINTQSKWHSTGIVIASVGAGSVLTLAIVILFKYVGT